MDEEVMEFGIAHSRKYSRDHLWYQEKDDRLVIGISDFLAADIGEVLRIILPHAETEVDDRQINLTRFPIRFPEKRDFFLEGANIFRFASSSGVYPYFSRKIGLRSGNPIPILYGGRVIGKIGKVEVAAQQVKTRETDRIHFAFLDGDHKYSSLKLELEYVSNAQDLSIAKTEALANQKHPHGLMHQHLHI